MENTKTTHKLKVGNIVKLSGYPGKEIDRYNPKFIEGTVISTTGELNPIIVEWANGIRNSYIDKFLEIV